MTTTEVNINPDSQPPSSIENLSRNLSTAWDGVTLHDESRSPSSNNSVKKLITAGGNLPAFFGSLRANPCGAMELELMAKSALRFSSINGVSVGAL